MIPTDHPSGAPRRPQPFLVVQAGEAAVQLDLPSAEPGPMRVMSYTRTLELGERVGEMLRHEVARHLYNNEPIDEDDDHEDYVRSVATSRPPMLEGIVRMRPEGLSAILSGGLSPAPGSDSGSVVVPFAPAPPPRATREEYTRSVMVVPHRAGKPDLIAALQLLRLAEDGLSGLVASRYAPHAPESVQQAAASVAAELTGQVAQKHQAPARAIDALGASGYAQASIAFELFTRGYGDLANDLLEAVGDGDLASDMTPAQAQACHGVLASVPARAPATADAYCHADDRLDIAVEIRAAFDEHADDMPVSVLEAIEGASHTDPLPLQLAAEPEIQPESLAG
jgi:hypothetical protein